MGDSKKEGNFSEKLLSYRLIEHLGHFREEKQLITICLCFRCGGDYAQAKKWHERQLDVALAARDKVRCFHLFITYNHNLIITNRKADPGTRFSRIG